MTMKQHPLSAAFPAMSAEDFAALVEDIEANGQREPIMTLDGMVLDGWHRYSACMQLGIKAQTFTFPADKDPVAFVKSHNLHRRHMTASQRAVAIVACSEWVQRGKPSSKPEMVSGLREKDMAKEAGTSDRTIRDAKVAHKAGLGDAVKDGAMTAHEAAQVARGKTSEKPKDKPKADAPKKADATPAIAPAELTDARKAIAILSEENDRLNDRLAVEAMDASEEEKTRAKELIDELRAKVKTLEAELAAVKASRDTYMRESGEKTKQINYWRKRAEKVAA